MKRLRNTATSVQVLVTDDKANRLIADGTYKAVPDAEQPPKETAMPRHEDTSSTGSRKPGRTSIASAIRDEVGPMWDHAN